MKSVTIALALTLIATGPALAGASVTNSTSKRSGHVRSTMKVDTNIHRAGTQYNFSESLKLESNGPGFAYANVNFNGYGFTGSAYADNVPNNPDPVAIGVRSRQTERVSFSENTSVNLTEKFSGYQSDWTHSVETDTF